MFIEDNFCIEGKGEKNLHISVNKKVNRWKEG